MIIRKQFKARCKACGQDIDLFNYEGLDSDSRMGSHHCTQMSQYFIDHPRVRKLFTHEREVPITGHLR